MKSILSPKMLYWKLGLLPLVREGPGKEGKCTEAVRYLVFLLGVVFVLLGAAAREVLAVAVAAGALFLARTELL